MKGEGASDLKNLDGGLLLDCLSRMRWRLKAPARHRLAIDIAALCMGLRVAVMVDYAWEVSQLQDQLCKLLDLLALVFLVFLSRLNLFLIVDG